MKKVIVTSDEAGNVIIPSKNKTDWGYIRVSQNRLIVDDNGFVHPKNLSALITGKIEDLKLFGYVKGQEVEGKIIFKESLEAFDKVNPERDYKKAGNTGVICCVDGAPIYRKHIYTQNSEAVDVCVEHTNGEEIKIAYEHLKSEEGNSSNGIEVI